MNNLESILLNKFGEKLCDVYKQHFFQPEKLWQAAKPGFLFDLFKTKDLGEDHSEKFFEQVDRVLNERKKFRMSLESGINLSGRFLSFDPNCTMYDGLAGQFSDGFFDSDDCPPPEFWLGENSAKLVCFIPFKYLTRAQSGIECCLSGSLEWMSQYVHVGPYYLESDK